MNVSRFYDFCYQRHINNDTGKYDLDKLESIKSLTWNDICLPDSGGHQDPRHIHEGSSVKWFTPKDDDFDKECEEEKKVVPTVPTVPVSSIFGNRGNAVIYNYNPEGLVDNTKEYLARQREEALKRGNGIRGQTVILSEQELAMYNRGYQQAVKDILEVLDALSVQVSPPLRQAACQIVVMIDDTLEEMRNTTHTEIK